MNRPTVAPARLLVSGGVLFTVGVVMHPHEHVEGGTIQEQFHAMFSNPMWYPSHALLLLGLALIATALVSLARGARTGRHPRLPLRTIRFAAVASTIATLAMVLHLVAKLDEPNIVAGASTPLLYTHAGVETLVVPLFGVALAMLAWAAGANRSLGNRAVSLLGVLGGLGYALAGATAPFTPTFTPLFDLVALVGVWAATVGTMELVQSRHPAPVHQLAR